MMTLSESALSRLATLIDIISPSMQERDMQSHLKSDWESVVPDAKITVDVMGNLEFSVRRDDSFPTLALVAHADTI